MRCALLLRGGSANRRDRGFRFGSGYRIGVFCGDAAGESVNRRGHAGNKGFLLFCFMNKPLTFVENNITQVAISTILWYNYCICELTKGRRGNVRICDGVQRVHG